MLRQDLIFEALDNFGVITPKSHPMKFMFGCMKNRLGYDCKDCLSINNYYTFNFWNLRLPTLEGQYLINKVDFLGDLTLLIKHNDVSIYTDSKYLIKIYDNVENNGLDILTEDTDRTDSYKVIKNDEGVNVYYKRVNLTCGNCSFLNEIAITDILNYYKNKLSLRDSFIGMELSLQRAGKAFTVTTLLDKNLTDYMSSLIYESCESIDETLMRIMKEILSFLGPLKSGSIQFNHSCLTTENILVKSGDSNTIGCKITNFGKSSITLNGVRFYNNSMSGKTEPIEMDEDCFLLSGEGDDIKNKYINYKRFIYSSDPPPMSYDIAVFIASMTRHPLVINRLVSGKLKMFKKNVLETAFSKEDLHKLLKISLIRSKRSSFKSFNRIIEDFGVKRIKIKTDLSKLYSCCNVFPPKPSSSGMKDYQLSLDDNSKPVSLLF